MNTNSKFFVNKREVGIGCPAYFIADIAANHDGSLERAIDLIHLAAEAGADAAKFQHFRAESIVSGEGFDSLGLKQSHQAKWKRSVVEVYRSASVPWEWTESLKKACASAKIDFFTSPYDLEMIDMLAPHVPAFKVGSGDITWLESIDRMAEKGKPVFLAAGASSLVDVQRAMNRLIDHWKVPTLLMQCNTNYTASLENFKYIQLNVLKVFKEMYPGIPLGLSDHTPGHATVLGAVALGAVAIEKHFTDDINREGPDHLFSMDPKSWKDMVERTRELEAALGNGNKKVEENERETIVVQRRCVRAARDLNPGHKISQSDLVVLRPAPKDSIAPYEMAQLFGKEITTTVIQGAALALTDYR